VFLASAAQGLPDGVTPLEATRYSLEESRERLCDERLELVEGFPISIEDSSPDPDEREWLWHREWMQAGLQAGGKLYVCRFEGDYNSAVTYYVIKDAQILAWMITDWEFRGVTYANRTCEDE
jgi:hypothetical protein